MLLFGANRFGRSRFPNSNNTFYQVPPSGRYRWYRRREWLPPVHTLCRRISRFYRFSIRWTFWRFWSRQLSITPNPLGSVAALVFGKMFYLPKARNQHDSGCRAGVSVHVQRVEEILAVCSQITGAILKNIIPHIPDIVLGKHAACLFQLSVFVVTNTEIGCGVAPSKLPFEVKNRFVHIFIVQRNGVVLGE